MAGLTDFWRGMIGAGRAAVSGDFGHALMREVLRSELLRIKALS
jgi:hypothetical protein